MYATLKQFGLPAVAGSTAVLANHPLALVKSRPQLDNELRARGATSQYDGWLDCVKTSWARGGARDLWRGVQFGVAREFVFNAARIGSFDFFKVLLADFPPIFAGFCSGALGIVALCSAALRNAAFCSTARCSAALKSAVRKSVALQRAVL